MSRSSPFVIEFATARRNGPSPSVPQSCATSRRCRLPPSWDHRVGFSATGMGPPGGPHPVTVSYSYDGAGNLTSRTDPSGTTTFTYDGRNLVLSRTASSGGGTLSYGYDLDANLTSVTDPAAQQLAGSSTTSYSYNDRNLLTAITDPAGKQWSFLYDADGRRILTQFGTQPGQAGKTVTTYDKSGRITSIKATGTQNGTIFSASYCYSPFVSGKACPSGSASTDTSLVQYLTTAAGFTPGTSVFAYDKGNRLTKATSNVFSADPLRMAVHAGEVSYERHGVAGGSVNLAFRLADPLRAALAGSPGLLAVITSSWFFEEVVRHSPASHTDLYRPVRVTVKETSTVGWICQPGSPGQPVAGLALSSGAAVPRQLPAAVGHFAGRRLSRPRWPASLPTRRRAQW